MEGEAWSAIQQDDPRDLFPTIGAGGRRWPSLVLWPAGWIELRLVPRWELERTQRVIESRYMATVRVLVDAEGAGEFVILYRDGHEFETGALAAGVWSEPIEVPSDETLLVQWSQAGAVVAAESVVVPKGRHVDLRLPR
jgi:hypothetical protein